MDDIFHQLETRLKRLVHNYEQLKLVNNELRQSKSFLAREKELLLAKNKIAISQIEAMVAHLKSIERIA